MYSKILQPWLALQRNIPILLRFKFIAVIFLGGILEIIGLGAIFPILKILMDLSNVDRYQMYVPYNFASPDNFLLVLLIACVIFYTFKNVFLGYSTYQIFKSVFYLQDIFSKKIFKNLLSANYSDQRSMDINKQSSFLVNDIPLVCIQWYLPSMYLISDIFTMSLLLIFLAWMNPFLLLATVLFGSLLFGLVITLSRKYSYKWGLERKFFDEVKLDYFINGLSHIKEIITYNKIHFYLSKFNEANSAASKVAMLQSTAQVLPKFFVESIAIFALLGIIFFMVIMGYDIKSEIPLIGIYAVAAFRIIPTINRMLQSYQMLQYGLDSTKELISGISCGSDNFENLNSGIIHDRDDAINFSRLNINGLFYIHEGKDEPVLRGLSLNLSAGQKIAIVGQSGVGKSTLIDVLLGLNIPTRGQIEINDKSIFNYLNAWRDIIGYVPQDLHLTATTIRDNIVFGGSPADFDKVLFATVVNITGIGDFIGGDIDCPLGRQGLKISGGQKQRIAIARALYKRPQVLIFDEATSALDQQSEKELMDNIKNNFPDISLISVTHKIYDNKLYDKIYQLKDGVLKEFKD